MTTGFDVTEVRDVTPDGGEGLVALVLRRRYTDPKDGPSTAFLTDPSQPAQVGVLRRKAGDRVEPHAHFPRARLVERTQEVLVVQSGSLVLSLYACDGRRLPEFTLLGGDVAVLLGGGHSIVFTADTTLLEVKTGPYGGKELDKYTLTVRE